MNAEVIDAVRTPRGRGKAGKGSLSGIHPQELLAQMLAGFAFDVTRDYSDGALPVRFLAEGRDASATSDGDPTIFGVLGEKVPRFGEDGWRWF